MRWTEHAQHATKAHGKTQFPTIKPPCNSQRDLGDGQIEGTALEQLGAASSEQGDWDSALDYFNGALEKLTRPEDLERRVQLGRAQVDALRRRSEIARGAEKWTDADRDLSAALTIAGSIGDSTLEAQLLAERGHVAAGQALWNDAIDLYSTADARLDESSVARAAIEHAQAAAYHSLGDSEHNAQNWEGAEAAYSQALSLQSNPDERVSQAVLLTALGNVAARQARWGEAVERLTRARDFTPVGAIDSLASLQSELARATIALKREQQARR